MLGRESPYEAIEANDLTYDSAIWDNHETKQATSESQPNSKPGKWRLLWQDLAFWWIAKQAKITRKLLGIHTDDRWLIITIQALVKNAFNRRWEYNSQHNISIFSLINNFSFNLRPQI